LLNKRTCKHLEEFLSRKPRTSPADKAAELFHSRALEYTNTEGVYKLFLSLRKVTPKLSKIGIQIIIRWKTLGQPRRQVMREIKLKSVSRFYEEYWAAVKGIKEFYGKN